ncbi:MAG: glycoside hydrolase family 28 protein [Chitinophagaceae bacterium]|nr:MAG: glycoside hydrolase family 28 protein [Chitinophagaceae bacterium]
MSCYRRFLLRSIVALVILQPIAEAAAQTPASRPYYNVREFNAKGNGVELDTDGINRAITSAAAAGGGTVYFPPGIYLSSSIELKDNITLYLEAGSTIEAVSDSIAKYNLPEPNEAGGNFQDYGHSHWKNSLIWGIGLKNVSISGPGLIHGKGLHSGFDRFADESRGQKIYQDGSPGSGNKAIALRDCRNVILRDFSILHGGHFGILATGVDNLTIDNLKIDSNRDGMDIDACQNVRIINCSVNTPWDDGICLKASYGLGKIRHCDNITISNCFLSGNFDEGSLLDATFRRSSPEYKSYKTGRIKLGTESNGDFKNITISNCVFDESRGIAIESVDGSHIEDVAISNITMRHAANSPLFIRLGSRLRGPDKPLIGSIKRISIDNLIVFNAGAQNATTISGLPGHPVEDIRLSNIYINYKGGGKPSDNDLMPIENEKGYPEPGMFGALPAYGFFIRHARAIEMNHVKLDYSGQEYRNAFVLDDVHDAFFDHLNIRKGSGEAAFFELRKVSDFAIESSRGIAPQTANRAATSKKIR